MLKNIRNKYNLEKLYTADALSAIGDVFYYIVLISYASRLKNAALAISLITTFEYIPPVFSAIIGHLADKIINKTKAAVYINLIQAILYSINALMFVILHDWFLLIFCIIINFVSDSIGIITEEIEPVLIKRLNPQIDFEKKYGILSAVSQTFSITGKFLGGVLLTLLSQNYALISLINALTFFFAAICLFCIKNITTKRSKQQNEKQYTSIFYLKNNATIRYIILLMASLNIILAPVLPLVYILLTRKQFLTPITYSLSVATLTGVDSIASILGSTIGLKIIKGEKALINAMILCSIFSTLFCCSLYTKNFYIILIFLLLSSFFVGIAIPLMFGKVTRSVPESKLGSINGLIDSILAITPPISIFIFTSLSEAISINFIIGILIFYGIVLSWLIIKKQVIVGRI